MVFNSYIFILAYLPVVVLIYFLLGKLQKTALSKAFLVLASVIFIAYADVRTLLFLLISGTVNYLISLLLHKKVGKVFLALGILINVIGLGYFKYSNFIIDNLNKHLGMNVEMLEILVPLGISFVTFQQIMYLVDRYKGKISSGNPLDYLFYVLFFPKLVQGPITDYNKLLGSFDDSQSLRPDEKNIAYGLWLFAIGLGKKVLIADVLSKAVSYGWNNFAGASSLELLISSLCYTFQIYFDFSGYSSMAIGVATMLNISLNDNFDHPYKSLSIGEFWDRWHISLTRFLREYLYFPLGGSRKGKVRTYINILIVFLVSGIWHGASWSFIFWGLLHGVAQCIDRLLGERWKKLNDTFRWICTFSFVNLAWIFFRSESVTQAITIVTRILRLESTELSQDFISCFVIDELAVLTARFPNFADFILEYRGYGLILYMIACFSLVLCGKTATKEEFNPGPLAVVASSLILFFSIISLSTVVEFIYGGF